MIIIEDKPIAYFDVDETIIYWNFDPNKNVVQINDNDFNPHNEHIEQIKKHKARNHNVVIWSAGGSSWAEDVIKALQLEEYVDIIMPKPYWAYDDLPADKFMKIVYLKDNQ